MTQLTRIVSSIGIASIALSIGCGGPMDVDSTSQEIAIQVGPPRIIKLPPGWPPPVVYPDYGIPDETSGCGGCAKHLPAKIDLERWDGHNLWGTHSGVIMPYYAFTDETRTAENLNRLEIFGVDIDTQEVIWHVFAAPDPDGRLPAALLAMAGTYDPLCQFVKFGTGGLSSGKPPKDPPLPPDGTRGGCSIWCPAWAVVRDAQDRVAGCGGGGQ